MHRFTSLAVAQHIIQAPRLDYNQHRLTTHLST